MGYDVNTQVAPQRDHTEQPRTCLTRPLAFAGRRTIAWVNDMGAAAIFLLLAAIMIFRPKQIPKIAQQVYYIGALSVDDKSLQNAEIRCPP